MSICILVASHFGFERGTVILIAQVPVNCLLFIFEIRIVCLICYTFKIDVMVIIIVKGDEYTCACEREREHACLCVFVSVGDVGQVIHEVYITRISKKQQNTSVLRI